MCQLNFLYLYMCYYFKVKGLSAIRCLYIHDYIVFVLPVYSLYYFVMLVGVFKLKCTSKTVHWGRDVTPTHLLYILNILSL